MMTEALTKAKGALDQIREMGEGYDGANVHHLDLMTLARTQAEIAQAEALTDIAKSLRNLTQRPSF